jgi:hypothetical protein
MEVSVMEVKSNEYNVRLYSETMESGTATARPLRIVMLRHQTAERLCFLETVGQQSQNILFFCLLDCLFR